MSEICLFNLRKHYLKYNELKDFSKRIVEYALQIDKGIYFNSLSNLSNLICETKMRDYFLVTDSFYSENSEFVSTVDIFNSDLEIFEKNFKNKFSFFDKLLKIIFEYEIVKLEIYISEGVGDYLEDYDEIETTSEKYLSDIFSKILEYKDEMAYTIPNLKLIIKNDK